MNKKLKVLRVTTVLDFGGIEKRLANTAQHTDDEVEFVFVSLSKGGWAARAIQKSGKRTILLEASYKIPSIRLLLRLVELFRREMPDVVHTSGAEANFHGIVAARIARVPVIVGEEVGFPRHGRMARSIFRLIYGQCTHFIAISKAVKARLVELEELRQEKIAVVYNPVPLPSAVSQEASARSEVKFLTVCRLEKVKNLDATIRALSKLRRVSPPFTFTIVGDGPERGSLEALVDRLELQSSILFEGFQAETQQFYSSADIFLLPSFSEGLSNAILEAMSHKLLCIATSVGGPAELISDGVNGFLVDPYDADNIESVLRHSLEISAEQRHAMGDRAFRFVKENFSLSSYIGQLKYLYSS